MRTIKKPFRFERLEELPSVLKAAGCRLLSRRIESGTAFFDCRSAGGVDVRFWVAPKTENQPATFCASIASDFFQATIQLEPVIKVLALLEIRGFLLQRGGETTR